MAEQEDVTAKFSWLDPPLQGRLSAWPEKEQLVAEEKFSDWRRASIFRRARYVLTGKPSPESFRGGSIYGGFLPEESALAAAK